VLAATPQTNSRPALRCIPLGYRRGVPHVARLRQRIGLAASTAPAPPRAVHSHLYRSGTGGSRSSGGGGRKFGHSAWELEALHEKDSAGRAARARFHKSSEDVAHVLALVPAFDGYPARLHIDTVDLRRNNVRGMREAVK
jgi:hypothetical protein